MKIRLAILDDHQIVIDGLKLVFDRDPHIEVIHEATSGSQMLMAMFREPVDILMTDLVMPDMHGMEVCKQVRASFPDVKLMVLSMNGEGHMAQTLMDEVGIEGYLLKTASKEELLQAVHDVYVGLTFFDQEVIMHRLEFRKLMQQNEEIHLTPREVEVIKHIAMDMNNRQIADTLCISERTVETHRKNILRKTNQHTALALIEFARKRKII